VLYGYLIKIKVVWEGKAITREILAQPGAAAKKMPKTK
jgi:hypothetical protein